MPNLPHIDRMKFGIIDQNYMNTLAESSDAFEMMKPSLDTILKNESRKADESFFALVFTNESAELAYTTIGEREVAIAWTYSWSRVELTNLPTVVSSSNMTSDFNYLSTGSEVNTQTTNYFQSVYGGVHADTVGYAYNLAELSNIMTAPVIFGVDTASSTYPEGYSPQPLPSFSIVKLTAMNDTAGRPHFCFDRQGVHDGDCETA